MRIAPMSCGMKAKNALNPSCRDSTIYVLLPSVFLDFTRRASAGRRWPRVRPEGPTDEREEQREDARDREDRTQTLLRDVLRDPAGRTRQRHAGELIYE